MLWWYGFGASRYHLDQPATQLHRRGFNSHGDDVGLYLGQRIAAVYVQAVLSVGASLVDQLLGEREEDGPRRC